jgi:hypothetical protein
MCIAQTCQPRLPITGASRPPRQPYAGVGNADGLARETDSGAGQVSQMMRG